jgi:hypothetical protein
MTLNPQKNPYLYVQNCPFHLKIVFKMSKNGPFWVFFGVFSSVVRCLRRARAHCAREERQGQEEPGPAQEGPRRREQVRGK